MSAASPRPSGRGRRACAAAALALVAGVLALHARSWAESRPATVRALAGPLAAGQRAEASVQYRLADPLGGPGRTVRGTIAVEAPDFVRLEFTTGERVTLRSDGGEWLQPSARQMVRIPASRAEAALLWWRVLLPGSAQVFREDSIAPRRFGLTPLAAEAGPLRVVVTLDPRGFPRELAVEGGEDAAPVYRLSGWRFARARGPAAYRLTAPSGFEVVDLP